MAETYTSGKTIGDYELLECLAEHNDATVYRARVRSTDDAVLIVCPTATLLAPVPADGRVAHDGHECLVFEAPRPELETLLESLEIDSDYIFEALQSRPPRSPDSPTTSYNVSSASCSGQNEAETSATEAVQLVDIPGSLHLDPEKGEQDPALPTLQQRFVLQRKLGEGGFGEVYEAYDLRRQCLVAVKRLRRWDGIRLRRFKYEFRQISSLRHPHLVKCYELFLAKDDAFFSMEFVDGVSAQAWLLSAQSPRVPTETGSPRQRIVDLPRIRTMLGDLSDALAFLHANGKFHRDVKPSNIMLERGGRTLLLDFGLLLDQDDQVEDPRIVMGTPRYLAPEQLLRAPLSPAVDVYQLGLVAFEFLVGASPWSFGPTRVWSDRVSLDGARPSQYANGVPPDLDDLVAAMLRRDPGLRPTAQEVRSRLESRSSTPAVQNLESEAPFVGRHLELNELMAFVRDIGPGHAGLALVEGESGMGKSALLDHFRRDLVSVSDLVVLSGRCFEWETVPFNAFDPINDALIATLQRFTPSETAAIVGDDIEPVAHLFPGFSELICPEQGSRFPGRVLSHEARRRALTGYRAILARLAQRRRVVLMMDDLQWGDADSAAVLLDLMQPESRPAIAIVLSARRTEIRSPLIDVFHRLTRGGFIDSSVRVDLGPLPEQDARALCEAVAGPLSEDAVRWVLDETKGQPFFISELVRRTDRDARGASLDDLLRVRAQELSSCSRRLVVTLAVIAHPVTRHVVEAASSAADDGSLTDAWDELRIGRWVKSHRLGEAERVECYHDRIRESLAADLPRDDRRQLHNAIAHALLRYQNTSVEAIAMHFLEAGREDQAYPYAIDAAAIAQQALAFDQAARLFGICAAIAPSIALGRAHRLEQAKALALSGHGKEAADIYLDLATFETFDEALDLRRWAAEQLVSTGHVRQGLATLNAVLQDLGVSVPKTRIGILASHLALSLWLRIRAPRVVRPRRPTSSTDFAIVDCMRVLGALMSLVNPLMSAYFVRRHAMLALRSDDPRRVAQAFAEEGTYIAAHGGAIADKRESRFFAEAQRRAAASDDETRIKIDVLRGVATICHSNWVNSAALFKDCEDRLVLRHPGLTWELNQARLYRLYALRCLGRWREVASAARAFIDEAHNRQDRYAEATYRTFIGDVPALLDDAPDLAIETIMVGLERWEEHDYDIIRVTAHEGICNAELYREHGEGRRALERVLQYWDDMKRSGTWFVQTNRIVWQDIRARACLAAAAVESGAQRRHLLREARRYARALGRSDVDFGCGYAERLWAAIAVAEGDVVGAIGYLQRAEEFFQRCQMQLMQAASSWRRAQLLGGDEGARMLEIQLAIARREGSRNPEALFASMVPGAWTSALTRETRR